MLVLFLLRFAFDEHDRVVLFVATRVCGDLIVMWRFKKLFKNDIDLITANFAI